MGTNPHPLAFGSSLKARKRSQQLAVIIELVRGSSRQQVLAIISQPPFVDSGKNPHAAVSRRRTPLRSPRRSPSSRRWHVFFSLDRAYCTIHVLQDLRFGATSHSCHTSLPIQKSASFNRWFCRSISMVQQEEPIYQQGLHTA
jgi:hypothetical protein